MKRALYSIERNRMIANEVWEMVLLGDTAGITAPGQFINIKLDGYFLRRPISICDWDGAGLTIIYKVVGQGTEFMSHMTAGQKLDILIGLGNGYDTSKCGQNTVIIGGGAGIPPLYGLAKRLLSDGKKVTAILGFNTKSEIFYEEKFKSLGIETTVTTVDGSYGKKGFVTDAFPAKYDYFCACGPLPMLKAVYEKTPESVSGQLSFEERMGCGFGACMGCSCRTKNGAKRVCKDGPILEKEEIIWQI